MNCDGDVTDGGQREGNTGELTAAFEGGTVEDYWLDIGHCGNTPVARCRINQSVCSISRVYSFGLLKCDGLCSVDPEDGKKSRLTSNT